MNTKKFDLKKFLLNNNTYVIFLVFSVIIIKSEILLKFAEIYCSGGVKMHVKLGS